MKDQFMALIGMILHPKDTLISLPSERFFILSFIISAYFAIARAMRKGQFYILSSELGKMKALIIMSLLLVIGFIIGALICKGIIRLFGKKITMKKIMNIIGYSQTPRLLLAVPVSILYAFLPLEVRAGVFTGESKVLISILGVLAVVGIVLLIYSTYLMIWAFVKCPDCRKET